MPSGTQIPPRDHGTSDKASRLLKALDREKNSNKTPARVVPVLKVGPDEPA